MQLVSHSWHASSASANDAYAVQSSTQPPFRLYGFKPPHVSQSAGPPPEHVLQSASQGAHAWPTPYIPFSQLATHEPLAGVPTR